MSIAQPHPLSTLYMTTRAQSSCERKRGIGPPFDAENGEPGTIFPLSGRSRARENAEYAYFHEVRFALARLVGRAEASLR